jgi:putative zinc finger/helix-turn-helix YgiT family protein
MRCLECSAQVIEKSNQTHRYTESGMDNVFISGINTFECPACDDVTVEIPDILGLHLAIASNLIRKPAKLAGKEIRFLRKNLGMLSKEFAALLGYSPEAYSRIERGWRTINDQGDRLIRLLFASRKTSEIETYWNVLEETIETFDSLRGEPEEVTIRIPVEPVPHWKNEQGSMVV